MQTEMKMSPENTCFIIHVGEMSHEQAVTSEVYGSIWLFGGKNQLFTQYQSRNIEDPEVMPSAFLDGTGRVLAAMEELILYNLKLTHGRYFIGWFQICLDSIYLLTTFRPTKNELIKNKGCINYIGTLLWVIYKFWL